jgi:hypothetical protein
MPHTEAPELGGDISLHIGGVSAFCRCEGTQAAERAAGTFLDSADLLPKEAGLAAQTAANTHRQAGALTKASATIGSEPERGSWQKDQMAAHV